MGLFSLFSKPKPESAKEYTFPAPTVEEFYVAGTYYHRKNIERLMRKSPAWDMSFEEVKAADKFGVIRYKYFPESRPAVLKIDPKSKIDPTGVQVLVDGNLIGFIADDKKDKVITLLKKAKITGVGVKIRGGPQRMSFKNGEVNEADGTFKAYVQISYN